MPLRAFSQSNASSRDSSLPSFLTNCYCFYYISRREEGGREEEKWKEKEKTWREKEQRHKGGRRDAEF